MGIKERKKKNWKGYEIEKRIKKENLESYKSGKRQVSI